MDEPKEVADHGVFVAEVVAAATAAGRPELGARLARVASPHSARSLRWGLWGLVLARGREAARRANDPETEAYLLHEDGIRSLLNGKTAAAAGMLAAAAALWGQLGQGAGAAAQHAAGLLHLTQVTALPPPPQPPPPPPGGPGAVVGPGPHAGAAATSGATGLKAVVGLAALLLGAVSLAAAAVTTDSDPSEPSAATSADTGDGGTLADATPAGSDPGTGSTGDPATTPPPDPGLSMLVETLGRESTTASFAFTVGDSATISGKLQFLSDEYPNYYPSEYNDLYSVTLATPQGVVVLGTGNLNSSNWGAGSRGYSGTAETIGFDEDLRRFAGQTVDLRIHVANVGDTAVDSAVLVSELRVDQAPPCSDDRLGELHGTPGEPADLRLDGLDGQLAGPDGARFENLVEIVAAEAGVDPGLLAVNALAERSSAADWLSPDPSDADAAGLGDWASRQAEIANALPGAAGIAPGPAPQQFANGRDALRAVAWTLRYGDERLAADLGPGYTERPTSQRLMLQRLAYNQSLGTATGLASAAGGSVLAAGGDPEDPVRAATIRAAQAAHIAYSVFGQGVDCA